MAASGDRFFDPAEVFAVLLRFFHDHRVEIDRIDMSDWRGSEDVAAQTQRLAREILRSGVVSGRQFTDVMSLPRRAFILMRAIDRVFHRLDPYEGVHDRGWLGTYGQRFRRERHYYADERLGRVLPRRCFPARPQPVPDKVTEYLQALMVATDVPGSLHFDLLAPELDFDERARRETARTKTIKVGCVPFVDRLDELEIVAIERRGSWYSISLKQGAGDPDWSRHWQRRSERALANLDASGAHIGVLPELSLTDELLAWWRDALRHTPRPPESRLQWILVGTGPLADGDGDGLDRRPNRATLLHRRTGETILEQDKCEAFSLSDEQIVAWQLRQLRPGPRAEWMRRPRPLRARRLGRPVRGARLRGPEPHHVGRRRTRQTRADPPVHSDLRAADRAAPVAAAVRAAARERGRHGQRGRQQPGHPAAAQRRRAAATR
jgi:hypothetical protein